MATSCYAQVRGEAIRVTSLDSCASVRSPFHYVVSKSVSKVVLDDVVESGSTELLREEYSGDARINLKQNDSLLYLKADIDFLRVDPDLLNLVSAAPVVQDASGDVVGIDANTRLPAAAFALEVWTKIAGQVCAPGSRVWGYTLLPYLRGGRLSGFSFDNNGAVSFNLRGAQVRGGSKWGHGPYDLEGPGKRLLDPIGPRTLYRNTLTEGAPPPQTNGAIEAYDVVDGGDAFFTSPDVIDGGSVETSPWVLDGGLA